MLTKTHVDAIYLDLSTVPKYQMTKRISVPGHSDDFKLKIAKALDSGMNTKVAAKKFGVHYTSAARYFRAYKNGELAQC